MPGIFLAFADHKYPLFYAAANPTAVLELLDEIARQQAEIKRLRAICVKAKDMLLYSDTMYYLDVAGILEDATLGGER